MSDFDPVTPVGGDTPATPAPATPQGTPAAPVAAATPNATPAQAPATGAVPEGYVPSYRIRETRENLERQFAEEKTRYQTELSAMQNKLRILAGVEAPPNPEVEAVRQQFTRLYPGLAKLDGRADVIEQFLEKADAIEQQTNHYWNTYTRQTLDKLFSLAEESYGAPLTDQGKATLHSSFVGFVQSSPEIQARYAEDPNLVVEFWKAFSSNFIDPVRRNTVAGAANRAPHGLPQDTPAGAPQTTPSPRLNGLDERANAAWAMFDAARQR